MVRIAHVADTHLSYRAMSIVDRKTGVNQRARDVEQSFERVVDAVIAAKVDIFIHAGDVFHQPRPSWSAQSKFIEQMQRICAAGIPAIVIAGNHDLSRMRTAGTVFSVMAKALPKVIFVVDDEVVHLPFLDLELQVCAIPVNALRNPVNPPRAVIAPGFYNVLVTHGLVGEIPTAKRGVEPGEEQVDDSLLGASFDYIALGDYHVFQQVRANAWYSGATERYGWGDADVTPGWALVTITKHGVVVERQEVATRPMIQLDPVDVAGEDVNAAYTDVAMQVLSANAAPGTMARIDVTGIADQATERALRDRLRRASWANVWSLAVTTQVKDRPKLELGDVVDLGLVDIPKTFVEFVNGRSYDEPFNSLFQVKGLHALMVAAEQADARSIED